MACAKDCRGARLGCTPPCRSAPRQKVAPSEKHRHRSLRPDPAEMVPDKSPPLVKGSARRRGRELVEGGRGGVLRDGKGHRVWTAAAVDRCGAGVEEAGSGRRERCRRRRRHRKSTPRDLPLRKTPPPPSLPQCGLSRQTAPAAAGWRSGGRRLAADGILTPPEPP